MIHTYLKIDSWTSYINYKDKEGNDQQKFWDSNESWPKEGQTSNPIEILDWYAEQIVDMETDFDEEGNELPVVKKGEELLSVVLKFVYSIYIDSFQWFESPTMTTTFYKDADGRILFTKLRFDTD